MNRRIPNGTYGGVRGMNNLYSIGERSEPITGMLFITYESKEKHRASLPADLYLTTFLPPAILTEILLLRLRMTHRAGR